MGRLIPAGTGTTKARWQKIAALRDAELIKEDTELSKEKQLPPS